MAIQYAIKLLKAMDSEPLLRKELYQCNTQTALFDHLKQNGFDFNAWEFEEAITHLHVQCQTYEEANILMSKAQWFNFLLQNLK